MGSRRKGLDALIDAVAQLQGAPIPASVLEPDVLDWIPAGRFCDFGKDVMPRLVQGQPVYAMNPNAYIQDTGTPERLAKAQRDYERGLK